MRPGIVGVTGRSVLGSSARWALALAVGLVALSTAGACSKATSPATSPDASTSSDAGTPPNIVGTGAQTTQTIGPSGGTISLEGLTLVIPPNALATPVDVTLVSTTVNLPEGQMLSPLYGLLPDNLQFAIPATITVTSPYDVSGADMLTFSHAAGNAVTWFEPLPASRSGTSMTGKIRHFSGVGLEQLAPCDSPPPNACSGHCGGWVRSTEDTPFAASSLGADGQKILPGFINLVKQCKVLCPPCPPDASSDNSAAEDSVTIEAPSIEYDDYSTATLDSVACNPGSVGYASLPISINAGGTTLANDHAGNGGHRFDWGIAGGTSTISMDGETIYQGVTPSDFDSTFHFDSGGTIPPITMTAVSPKVPAGSTITLSGTAHCSESSTVVAGSDAGSADAAADAGPCANVTCTGKTCCSLGSLAECVDLNTDITNCGFCNLACSGGEACVNGICVGTDAGPCANVTCPGKTCCSLGSLAECVDLNTDFLDCGFCNLACSAGQACVNGVCVTPPADAGPCATVTCLGKTCCSLGSLAECVDLNTDVTNCGFCNLACSAGEACVNGICVPADAGADGAACVPYGQFCAADAGGACCNGVCGNYGETQNLCCSPSQTACTPNGNSAGSCCQYQAASVGGTPVGTGLSCQAGDGGASTCCVQSASGMGPVCLTKADCCDSYLNCTQTNFNGPQCCQGGNQPCRSNADCCGSGPGSSIGNCNPNPAGTGNICCAAQGQPCDGKGTPAASTCCGSLTCQFVGSVYLCE